MKSTWNKDILITLAELKHFTPQDKDDYFIKNQLLNRWLTFVVKSPETHNFSQYFHFYHPLRMIYRLPIRGWNGKWTRYYWYEGIDLDLIIKAVQTINYGRAIFSLLRHYFPKGVSAKDIGLLKYERRFRKK